MSPTLYLAPLHGVTNYVYRNAVSRHFTGLDAVVAPFISSINSETSYAKGRANHFKDVLPEHNTGMHIIPQLLSNDSKSFIETAVSIKELGYEELNWNLGCPAAMVTRKKRGSGLLPHPDLIENMLTDICSKLDMRISVKVRLGLTCPTEITALMPVFNSFPLTKVIIHPRIATQMYKGNVDIEGFSQAAQLSKHPVMYNGDITNAQTFFAFQKKFPDISEWMIGRSAIDNPFIFEQITGTVCTNQISRVRDFHDDLYSSYKNALQSYSHVLDKMKEIWLYLGNSFTVPSRLLRSITLAKTFDAYETAVENIFAKGEWNA